MLSLTSTWLYSKLVQTLMVSLRGILVATESTSFTNVPLKETNNVYTNLLYNNVHVVEDINKSKSLSFEFILGYPGIIFSVLNDILFKQMGGAAMGSLLGLHLANVFLSFYEIK